MSVENERNRDIFLKFCFIYFLNHILTALGIDEEIVDMLPTEKISYKKTGRIKIFNNLFDFKALTKSGKIIIFEFKKNILRTDDLKQAFDYYTREFCRNDEDVELIMIVLSKGGKIKEYAKLNLTFHPTIIKTKKINKQKDLNQIKNKFDNNEKLTIQECSLLIALPLFDVKESESDIVRQTCLDIKNKKDCIPEEKLDEVIIGSYLNIIEYVDVSDQKELMEMIGMAKKAKGVLESYKEEMKLEMKDDVKAEVKEEVKAEVVQEIKGEYDIEMARKLKSLLSPEEIVKVTGLSLKTVLLL